MAEISRRGVLGGISGVAGALTLSGCMSSSEPGPGPSGATVAAGDRRRGSGLIHAENRKPGTAAWRTTAPGFTNNTDAHPVISAFASKTSVRAGETLDFFVSTENPGAYQVTVYRLGYYGGAGGREVHTGTVLAGHRQATPTVDAMGTVRCAWDKSWSLEIPATWVPGLYLATFVTANGTRAYSPFVVQGDHKAAMLLVVPFACYQAYNQYPFDGVSGKNLYYGFVPSKDAKAEIRDPDGHGYTSKQEPRSGFWLNYSERARAVSFQRPYANNGVPADFDITVSFVRWAESEGYDVDYASNLDFENGRADLTKYQTVVLTGHDEYWSAPMRTPLEEAVAHGTNLLNLAANAMFWHTRNTVDAHGFTLITCFKNDPDKHPDASGPTGNWRYISPGGTRGEQTLLGTMYNGVLPAPMPLIVANPDHWLWAGTGVKAGEEIPLVLRGEADGFLQNYAGPTGALDHVLLTNSPYPRGKKTIFQSTSVYQAPSGALVFNAGTFGWNDGLDDTKHGHDARIVQATLNVMHKLGL